MSSVVEAMDKDLVVVSLVVVVVVGVDWAVAAWLVEVVELAWIVVAWVAVVVVVGLAWFVAWKGVGVTAWVVASMNASYLGASPEQ